MGRKSVPVLERVWKYVEVPEDKTQCWLWTGSLRGKGYPNVIFERTKDGKYIQREPSHMIYEQVIGEVPKGKYLSCTCGNHGCVNPHHRIICDQRMVNRLASSHGYMLRSCTVDDVQKIKALILMSKSNREIAAVTGIDKGIICRIRNNNSGKNIAPVFKTPIKAMTLTRIGNTMGVTRQRVFQLVEDGVLSWHFEGDRLVVTRKAEVYLEGVGRIDTDKQIGVGGLSADAAQAVESAGAGNGVPVPLDPQMAV